MPGERGAETIGQHFADDVSGSFDRAVDFAGHDLDAWRFDRNGDARGSGTTGRRRHRRSVRRGDWLIAQSGARDEELSSQARAGSGKIAAVGESAESAAMRA